MEERTKILPAMDLVISDDVDVQHPLTTQLPCLDSGSTSGPATATATSVNEECDEYEREGSTGNNNSTGKESASFHVETSSPERRQGDNQGETLPIQKSPAGKTDNVQTKARDTTDSSGCLGSVKASDLDSCIVGPTPDVVKVVEAASPDAGSPDAPIVTIPSTNQITLEERVRLHVPVQEMKGMKTDLSSILLLGLPFDALHAVASFLSPNDFCNFGLCSKGAMKVCRDVFRCVRLHGFRCATEVITAWQLNQHSDAKELCALYIGNGVPIYPTSLGHSYHTMVWRMGIEAQEMQNSSRNANVAHSDGEHNPNTVESSSPETDATPAAPVDPFFVERYDSRAREGLNFDFSYLEEKSLFMLNSEKSSVEAGSFAQSVRRQTSLGPNRFLLRPLHNNGRADIEDGHGEGVQAQDHALQHLRLPSTEIPRRGISRSHSHSNLLGRSPKVVVKVHRHLLDQHLLGCPCVDDKDGLMTTPPINLSADFFHPRLDVLPRNESVLQESTTNYASSGGLVSGEFRSAWNQPLVPSQHTLDVGTIGDRLADPVAGMDGLQLTLVDTSDDSESDGEPANNQLFNTAVTIFEPPAVVLDTNTARRLQMTSAFRVQKPSAIPDPSPPHPNILVNVDLEVYSASSAKKKNDVEQADQELRHHLRSRFAAYHRRLEHLLLQFDNHGFDECLLDFWDEFLPQTANIHYYDRNTAVPRISCLSNFLTRPCPKAIGVVQCEIERIKLGPKKKGVNMKGRFFPTYEYRLFIRHRPQEGIDGCVQPRRDTVLMMAKNRGRKHVEPSASNATGKKGANNYLLYIPQQEDIEQHFRSVNGLDLPFDPVMNGPSSRLIPLDGPALMGRLQSNFIGTEFQIFSPQVAKKDQSNPPKRSNTTPVNPGLNTVGCTEDELGYDSGLSSDNPSSGRRKSRFGRLSLRRNGGGNPLEPSGIAEEDSPMKPMRRSRSSGDMPEGNRRTRTSRRAIANNSEGVDLQCSQTSLLEEEDGAITYTANLLGSRPRIMDVCIPRVSPDGVPGVEWKRYLNKCLPDIDGGVGNRMLNHLKQIQQRLENDELGIERPNQGEVNTTNSSNTEDYSPPDDFGLLALQNRPPWWNVELGSFVLNFGGRVSVASVKNFQLCDRVDQDYIMLQFGRINGRHSFTMDFQHPLTAVQAFAIAISSLQSKISFG